MGFETYFLVSIIVVGLFVSVRNIYRAQEYIVYEPSQKYNNYEKVICIDKKKENKYPIQIQQRKENNNSSILLTNPCTNQAGYFSYKNPPYMCALGGIAGITYMNGPEDFTSFPINIGVYGEDVFLVVLLDAPNGIPFPSEIGTLTSVQFFASYLALTGTIPTQIGNMKALQFLYLFGEQISGSIPSQMGNLEKLNIVLFYHLALTSEIPSELSLLQNLGKLDIQRPANGGIPGNLPSEFYLLQSLTELVLRNYKYKGDLPKIFNPTNLFLYSIAGTQLTGTVPIQLSQSTLLDRLEIYANPITGSLPSQYGLLQKVSTFIFRDDKLTGEIPTQYGLMTRLTQFRIGGNMISGTFPSELGLLTKLDWLTLDRNQISGTLPSEIGKLTILSSLDCSSNRFSGELIFPNSVFDANLDDNLFSSTIPSTIGLLTQVTLITLNHNQLYGTMPTQIAILSSLMYFDISNNKFSGTIPLIIFELSQIKIDLSVNQFSGELPFDKYNDMIVSCDYSGIINENCLWKCVECTNTEIKVRSCQQGSGLSKCISIFYFLYALVVSSVVCILVLYYIQPKNVSLKLFLMESVSIIFSILTILSNILFGMGSDLNVAIACYFFICLSVVCQYLVGLREFQIAFKENQLFYERVKDQQSLHFILFLFICGISPKTFIFLSNYNNLNLETNLKLKIAMSTIILQFLPQLILQAYTVATVTQISTGLIISWIFTSLSTLNQFYGLALIFVVLGSIKRLSSRARKTSMDVLVSFPQNVKSMGGERQNSNVSL